MFEQKLKDLEISILINSASTPGSLSEDFWFNSETDVHNVITCNIYGGILLTREIV